MKTTTRSWRAFLLVSVALGNINFACLAQTNVLPVITKQPAGQIAAYGSDVTFQVKTSADRLGGVPIDDLALWLRADAGVATNSQGNVTLWEDQSTNANNALQTNVAQQPLLTNSSLFSGKPVIRFNGVQDSALGDFIRGYGDVGIGGDYTSFAVYEYNGGWDYEHEMALVGYPGDFSAVRGYYIPEDLMSFTGWSCDYRSSFVIPTNTARVWTIRLNSNTEMLDLFDATQDSGTNFSAIRSELTTPAAGYFLGGSAEQVRFFGGDIAELIYFKHTLTDTDRLAVEQYLKDKYYRGLTASGFAYQWQLNGTNIDGATNATLTLSSVQSAYVGAYSVIIRSAAGAVTSASATLDIVPLVITQQPSNQTLIVGDSLTNSVVVSGTEPIACQWFFNNSALDGATNSSLILTNIQLSGAGNYWVVASNSFGAVTSVVWTATVLEPPRFIQQPANLSAILGQNATNSVVVSGSAPIFYQWYFSNSPTLGATNTNFLSITVGAIWGATNADLVLNSVQTANAGNYFVIAWNAAGAATSSVSSLTVLSPPRIITQPVSKTVFAGANVTNYVQVTGDAPISYQWYFNSNSLSGATSSRLVLTNIQAANAGQYYVVASNKVDSVASAVFTIQIIAPPQITNQPASQTVISGQTATFTVAASGTQPLSYQWLWNGARLTNANNATLVITNATALQAGLYSVIVTNLAGAVASSNATLTVNALPNITSQPKDQSVAAGTNVLFSVVASDVIPQLSSGTVALWLRADSGVVTNINGKVSQWRDQSGNTNNALQTNISQQPLLTNSSLFSGQPVLRFNGTQDNINGDYLRGYGNVGIGGDYTSYAVYEINASDNAEHELALVGVPGASSAVRGYYLPGGTQLSFTGWGFDYRAPYFIPTNTARIWTMRMSFTNRLLEFFDAANNSETNFTFSTYGLSTPAAGYYIGGAGTQTRNFGGDIAELIYFRGALSDVDRLAVETYLKNKYIDGASSGNVAYQWLFNGISIDGATNASLAISNVQPANAGVYSVVVSNKIGAVTSSNATLTVNLPPSITNQPQSQTVIAGSVATLAAGVSGTQPLTYQWLFNGSALTAETNATLTLSNAQASASGVYALLVSSPFGSALSSNATLQVLSSRLQIVSQSATAGSTVVVPVQLVALGTENAASFSLQFDPTVLSLTSVSAGANASGAFLITNNSLASSGSLGVSLSLASGSAFPAGTQEVVSVTFAVAPVTQSQVSSISFIDSPIPKGLVDTNAHNIVFTTVGGSVSVALADYEADVTAKDSGAHTVSIADWVKVGRLVAGLDTPASSAEFQKADCAPRATLGDGQLSAADWVQAGRYAAALDPLTVAGGPTEAQIQSLSKARAALAGPSTPRSLTLNALPPVGSTNSFIVELAASGDENTVGFSLIFDPTVLRFAGYTPGKISGSASPLSVNANTSAASSGRIGFLVGLVPGASMTATLQDLVRVDFVALSFFSKPAVVSFAQTPIKTELVDSLASTLAVTVHNSNPVNVNLPPPSLKVADLKTNKQMSWSATASAFSLEWTPTLDGTWTPVTGAAVTNSDNVLMSVTNSAAGFYRLRLNAQ